MSGSSVEGVPGPAKVSKIRAQYPKRKSIGSIGSIILGILGDQVGTFKRSGMPAGIAPATYQSSRE